MKTEMMIIWGIVCLLCIVIEMTTGTFFLLCISVGALGALLAALMGCTFDIQLLTLSVVAALMIIVVRPLIVRLLRRPHGTARRTGADAVIGREGVVSQPIAPGRYGRVAIDGDDWKACAPACSEPLSRGTKVKVTGRQDSVILCVAPAQGEPDAS